MKNYVRSPRMDERIEEEEEEEDTA